MAIVKDNRKEFANAIEKTAYKALKAACEHNKSAIIMATPVNHGALREANDYKIKQKGLESVGQVGNPLEYAPFVHEGTGEFAKNGKGRKGGWYYVDEEGKGHFTRGQKPQEFIRKTMRKEKATTKKIIKEIMKGVGK